MAKSAIDWRSRNSINLRPGNFSPMCQESSGPAFTVHVGAVTRSAGVETAVLTDVGGTTWQGGNTVDVFVANSTAVLANVRIYYPQLGAGSLTVSPNIGWTVAVEDQVEIPTGANVTVVIDPITNNLPAWDATFTTVLEGRVSLAADQVEGGTVDISQLLSEANLVHEAVSDEEEVFLRVHQVTGNGVVKHSGSALAVGDVISTGGQISWDAATSTNDNEITLLVVYAIDSFGGESESPASLKGKTPVTIAGFEIITSGDPNGINGPVGVQLLGAADAVLGESEWFGGQPIDYVILADGTVSTIRIFHFAASNGDPGDSYVDYAVGVGVPVATDQIVAVTWVDSETPDHSPTITTFDLYEDLEFTPADPVVAQVFTYAGIIGDAGIQDSDVGGEIILTVNAAMAPPGYAIVKLNDVDVTGQSLLWMRAGDTLSVAPTVLSASNPVTAATVLACDAYGSFAAGQLLFTVHFDNAVTSSWSYHDSNLGPYRFRLLTAGDSPLTAWSSSFSDGATIVATASGTATKVEIEYFPADIGDMFSRTEEVAITPLVVVADFPVILSLGPPTANAAPTWTNPGLLHDAEVGELLTLTYADLVSLTGATDADGGSEVIFELQGVIEGMELNGSPVSGTIHVVSGDEITFTPTEDFEVTLADVYIVDQYRKVTASFPLRLYPAPTGFFAMNTILRPAMAGKRWSNTGGSTPQNTPGGVVNALTNDGVDGGLAVSTGFTAGFLLADDNGTMVLDGRGSTRVLGIDVDSGPSAAMSFAVLCRGQLVDRNAGSRQFPLTFTGTSDGSIGTHLWLYSQEYGLTWGNGTENWGLGGNASPAIDDSWHLVIGTREDLGGGAGTWTARVDRIPWDTSSVGAATTVDRFNLGGPFHGFVGFACCDRAVTWDAAFITKLENYLFAVHAAQLPATVDRSGVTCSDSTMTMQTCFSTNSSGVWAPEMHNCGIIARGLKDSRGFGVFYSNAWIGKQTSHHRTTADLDRIEGCLLRSSGDKLLILKTGVNDGYFAGLTAAQCWAQQAGLIDDVRARVPDVIVLVEHPNDGNPGTWGGGYPAFRAALCVEIDDLTNQATSVYTPGTTLSNPVGLPFGSPGRLSSYFSNPGVDDLHEVGPGQVESGGCILADAEGMIAP